MAQNSRSAIIKIDGIDTIVSIADLLKSTGTLYEKSGATRAALEAAIANLMGDDDGR